MKEYKTLLTISRGFVEKKHHRKINSIKDNEEKINLLKYMIISKMKLMHLELEMLLQDAKQIEDIDILLLKSSVIPHKIKLLEHNLNEKDFKKIILLINEIKKRI
jgi:hypothetical protein